MITLLLIAAFFLLAVGVPIGFAILIASWAAILVDGSYPQLVVLKEMFTGLDSFPLMAVPFFILAAELMSGGALTQVLLEFATQFFGRKRGGLGYASILSLTMFSGISGSALADAAGPGVMMVRMMDKSGYDRSYAAALTAATSIIGPIIPPSIIMIIYTLQDTRVSVGSLFIAGFLPGLLIALAMAVTNMIISHRRNYRSDQDRPSPLEMLFNTLRAIPALMLVVIIVAGIRLGVFTPTEASVVAVFYALFCGMCYYRTLRVSQLPTIIVRSALVTSAVLLIVGASDAFAWILTIEEVPQTVAHAIIAMEPGPIAFLLAVNLFLLVFGMFMESLPGVIVLVPILAPIAAGLGIDPTHFAIMFIVNLMIGTITPPVGALLFVVSSTTRVPIMTIVREIWPFYIAHFCVLLAIIFIPSLSTFLPNYFGR